MLRGGWAEDTKRLYVCRYYNIVGMEYSSRFWQQCERYHDLAKRYERGLEYTSPNRVTSNRWWCGCSWCATDVAYITDKYTNV